MIYVDDAKNKFGRSKMCHLFSWPPNANSRRSLAEFADKLGLKPEWVHYTSNMSLRHFDITQGKRQLAIQLGAESITVINGARMRHKWMRERRKK